MKLDPGDAETLLLRLITDRDHGGAGHYGYDFYLPHLVQAYLQKIEPKPRAHSEPEVAQVLDVLYPVAWRFCLRGILRPGVSTYQGQSTPDGLSNGYSLTPFGAEWLKAENKDDFLPTEPERFAKLLAPYRTKFGDAFHERAQEAMRCYGAQAYLACCVMCGASAEAILLVTADAKAGSDKAAEAYKGAAGRANVESILWGKSKLRDDAQPYLSLLGYWRTDGAHGKPSKIGENEAYTSLLLLLRFALFMTNNWGSLTRQETISVQST